LQHLSAMLSEDGHLVVEEHLQSTEDVIGPSNPAFRMDPGELRVTAKDLEVLYYHEGSVTDPDGRVAALSQLVARRPSSNY
jgi:hypothetical protein